MMVRIGKVTVRWSSTDPVHYSYCVENGMATVGRWVVESFIAGAVIYRRVG